MATCRRPAGAKSEGLMEERIGTGDGRRMGCALNGYFIGIDMGGSMTKAVAIDRRGRRVSDALNEISTGASFGPGHVVRQMRAAAELAMKPAGAVWEDVLGVILATPGPAMDGVIGKAANLPMLIGADMRGGLEEAIAEALVGTAAARVKVGWVNDANAGTYADWAVFGKPLNRGIIGLYPGTGLGAGYVDREGNLLVGEHGAGAELGHLPMPYWLMGEEKIRRCGCGRDGCVETGASIAGLKHQLAEALAKPAWAGHSLATLDEPIGKKAFSLRALAQNGDRLAMHLFARQAKVLAATLVVAQTAYDAGVAVIGGGLTEPTATTAEFRAWFLGEVRREFHAHALEMEKPIEVLLTEMGDMAQAVGAAELARWRFGVHQ